MSLPNPAFPRTPCCHTLGIDTVTACHILKAFVFRYLLLRYSVCYLQSKSKIRLLHAWLSLFWHFMNMPLLNRVEMRYAGHEVCRKNSLVKGTLPCICVRVVLVIWSLEWGPYELLEEPTGDIVPTMSVLMEFHKSCKADHVNDCIFLLG